MKVSFLKFSTFRKYYSKLLIFLSFSLVPNNLVWVQEQRNQSDLLSSFKMMKLVDEQMKINDGLNLAQLTVIGQKGSIKVFRVSHYKKGYNSLMIFKSLSRGKLLKLLYNSQDQKIYAYKIHSKNLSQKKFNDRFNSILNSGFYFIDLKQPFFIDNFISKINGYQITKKGQLIKIENLPLFNGLYGKLVVYVNPPKNYRLEQIDYFDKNNILLKTMEVHHGQLPSRSNKKVHLRDAPLKYKITDLSRNTISNLEYYLNDQDVQISSNIFQKDNIEK